MHGSPCPFYGCPTCRALAQDKEHAANLDRLKRESLASVRAEFANLFRPGRARNMPWAEHDPQGSRVMRSYTTELLTLLAAGMTALALAGPSACLPKHQIRDAVVRIDTVTDGACEVVSLVTIEAVPVAACLAIDALERLTIELLSAQRENRNARVTIAYPKGDQEVVIPVHSLDRALGQTQLAKARWSR